MKKRLLLVLITLLGAALYMGCSPVQFSTGGASGCSVTSPCITGTGLKHVDQNFTFATTNRVDILIVDDNSGSMTTEQQNLASPLNGFINNLNSSGLDWQVGITTTDICPSGSSLCGTGDNGAQGTFIGPVGSSPAFGFPSYIIRPGPTASSTFASTIERGAEVGSGDERAIYALNLAIQNRNTTNAGFFRDNSNLAVVILSDEDERSVGGDPAFSSDPSFAPLESNDLPQTFLNNVTTTWNGAKHVLVNSIIIKPNDSQLYPDPNQGGALNTCLNVQAHQPPDFTAHVGATYNQLSQLANGTDAQGNVIGVGSICNNGAGAFAGMLTNIAGLIQNLPNSNTVTLNFIPAVIDSVKCTLNGQPCTVPAFTLTKNQVTFATRPPNGAIITISYDFDPASQLTFNPRVLFNPRTLQLTTMPAEISDVGIGARD